MARVGAEKIALRRRAVRTHDDQVRMDGLRLFEHFVVDPALSHGHADVADINAALLGDDDQRLLGRLALAGIEIGCTYSASIDGVGGSTFSSRTMPRDAFASDTAVSIADLARSVSERSTGTRIFLNIVHPV